MIRTAMLRRCPVAAMYEDRQRLLCPHMLGRNKEGHTRILCYQYGGESRSGLRQTDGRGDWRCLSLEKISSVRLLNTPWPKVERPARRPTCIDQIEVEIEDQPDRDPQKGQ